MTQTTRVAWRFAAPMRRWRRAAVWAVVAVSIGELVGCQTPPPPVARTDALPFEQAANVAADSLAAQTQRLPAFLAGVGAKLAPRAVIVDPMIDAGSGQQTVATRQLEQFVAQRLRAETPPLGVLPFVSTSLDKVQYLMTGTLTRIAGGGAQSPLQINLALVDLKTGNVVAQASSRARSEGVDMTPTPYYRDSPILIKDKVVNGYVRTSDTAPGKPADASYLERLAAAMMIDEGTGAYNSERYQDALSLYRAALATPAGEQLRTLNGIYLASWKLGRLADAEAAFGRVVAFGLAGNNLGVKFLFNPGTTDFWSDLKVSGPYALWLRQIARQAAAAKVCMDVVGHTSHTGSEPVNDRLSQQRASVIRQRLGAEVPELNARTKSSGMGWRENLIGTGTDDASDALDRRVEFKIAPC